MTVWGHLRIRRAGITDHAQIVAMDRLVFGTYGAEIEAHLTALIEDKLVG